MKILFGVLKTSKLEPCLTLIWQAIRISYPINRIWLNDNDYNKLLALSISEQENVSEFYNILTSLLVYIQESSKSVWPFGLWATRE